MFLFAIHFYRVSGLSLLSGGCCRFLPTCSSYGEQALHRHGLSKGGPLTLLRLLRCHPLHPGGWDPVPL